MIYNENIYNLSGKAYNEMNLSKSTTNRDIKRKQNKLLKLLFKKFKDELTKQDSNNGILKVKFESIFWSDFNDGYNEINELIESENLNTFLREYCMYIGDIEYKCNEYTNAYYEIIWDYKTYYEQLFVKNIDILSLSNNDPNILKKYMDEYKKLPDNYQIEIINTLMTKIEEYHQINENDNAVKTCSIEGHQFTKWEKRTWTTLEDIIWEGYGPNGKTTVEHKEWQRTCKRCGLIQNSKYEPQELIDDKKEKNKQARIKKLERELKRLKNE